MNIICKVFGHNDIKKKLSFINPDIKFVEKITTKNTCKRCKRIKLIETFKYEMFK